MRSRAAASQQARRPASAAFLAAPPLLPAAGQTCQQIKLSTQFTAGGEAVDSQRQENTHVSESMQVNGLFIYLFFSNPSFSWIFKMEALAYQLRICHANVA